MPLKKLVSAENSLFRCFKAPSVVLFILFFIFSCSDQGCIEADDFGEYDTQTLEITSNSSAENCIYDVSRPLSDDSQGSGLKECFNLGAVTIYDENNVPQTSAKGCRGLPGAKHQNMCVNQCVANCNANIGVGSSSSSEPAWTATSGKNGNQNGGVTIKPNSQVYIRAIGMVRLGDKMPFPNIFISADDFMPQSKTTNWGNQTFDLKAGKTVSISFSGQINDGSTINGGADLVGTVGGGANVAIDNKVYNASRRLAIYMIQAPAGYSTDPMQPTEEAQYIGVPLLPDPNIWQCTYQGDNLKQSTCFNKSYKDNGYPNVDDALARSTFPISSDLMTSTLGQYGGIIRWDRDDSTPDSYNPFEGILCDDPACVTASVDEKKGRIVGDLSAANSAANVVITAPVAAKVSFKQLLSSTNTSCNADLEIVVRDATGNDLYFFDGAVGHNSKIAVTNTDWSSAHISVEPGHQIVISTLLPQSYSFNGALIPCGKALAIKFSEYKDIQINQSGLVSFAILGASVNQGCTIKARIINPNGSHTDNGTIFADFYEYSSFSDVTSAPTSPAIIDPLSNLVVPALIQSARWDNNQVFKAFVRKGQKIRFSPESWNATWSAVGGARECGIGMAMRIEPRPALLCRGYGVTSIVNPGCSQKYNTQGLLIGCDELSPECLDSTNAAYCPNPDCQAAINCTPGTAAGVPDHVPLPIPRNTRHTCSIVAINAGKCVISAGTTYSAASCNACSNLRKLHAEASPYQSMNQVAQCYDLEQYDGKVANIPINGGFTDLDLNTPLRSKGAKRLTVFNGEHGDLSGFGKSNKVDISNNNVIYQLTQPVSVVRGGRLKFLFLDGADFNQARSSGYDDNNPNRGDQYTGHNGFKIGLSSALEFNNGEWLEAKICQELATDPISCKRISLDQSAILSDQSKIVELNDPSGNGLAAVSKTPFYFDEYGTLVRSGAPVSPRDCVGALVGDTFYCHTNTSVDVSKIRITFKIKDPETPTCNTDDPTNTAAVNKNGIYVTNTHYRVSDCVVGNPTADYTVPKNGITVVGISSCISNAAKSGPTAVCLSVDDDPNAEPKKVCDKEFRCLSKYSNNSGKYYVTVRVKTLGSNISNIIGDVITPVIEVMDGSKDGTKIGQAERIYKLIIGDPRYQAILSISLVMMFTFYGFGYLIGVSESGISDIVSKLVKIALIYLFVGPEGWHWFNMIVVKFFKNGTDYLAFLMASSFDNSPGLQNAILNSDFYDKSILFSGVDKVFGIFFSSTVQKKISALLFASIFGWAYLLLIYYGMLLYVYAVANSVLLYLTSQVFISILFVLGPLFFVFTLFSQTKEMFDKWLSQLISFSLQQIFLLTTLAFFNMMMYEVIKMVLGYKICWDEVWTINIITRITLMSFWTIASLPPRVNSQSDAGNIGNPDGIPSFFTILFIWVIADLMLKFVGFMTDMAASISGGLKASSLASGIPKQMAAIAKTIKESKYSPVKAISDKLSNTASRIDQKLFDSGKLADQDREKRRQENSANTAHKKAFDTAGKAAVSNFKKTNAADLLGKSKDEQQKILTKTRNEAIAKAGEARHLTKEQTDKILKDKGFKNESRNAFVAAASFVKQATTRGGTILDSMDDRKVSASFSGKEAKTALKNTDTEGREKIVAAVTRGDIHVKKSGAEATKSALGGDSYGADATGKLKGVVHTVANIATLGAKPAIVAGVRAIKAWQTREGEYDRAREQLVASNDIAKMDFGSNFVRSEVEKAKIRVQAAKNKEERGQNVGKMSTDNTAAKMKQFAKAADDQESAAGTSKVWGSNVVSSVAGRDKTTAMGWDRDNVAKGVKTEREALAVTVETEKLATATGGYDAAVKQYEACDAKVTELQKDTSKISQYGAMTKKAADPATSKADKKSTEQAMLAMKSSPEYKKEVAELNENFAGRNKAFESKLNYEKASNNAKGALYKLGVHPLENPTSAGESEA